MVFLIVYHAVTSIYLSMLITVMSTIQGKLLTLWWVPIVIAMEIYVPYHAMERIIYSITMQWSSSIDDYHCNEHPLMNTMEIIIYIITMQWSSSVDDYHCNEHPLLNTMEMIIYNITMQWSPSVGDYYCNEHPLLNTMEMIICFFPCSDQHMFYHCNEHPLLLQWRGLFTL